MSTSWQICCLLLLVYANICQPFPHRFFRPISSRQWNDITEPLFTNNDNSAANNGGICVNFTKEFLREIGGSEEIGLAPPLFGWISAHGIVPLSNRTELAVKCLAIALSSTDLAVERKCIRTISPSSLNLSSIPSFSVEWPQGEVEGNLTLADEAEGEGDSHGSPIMLFGFNPNVQLPHRHQQKMKHRSFPCIFPINDRVSDQLAWNATICGLSKSQPADEANTTDKSRGHHLKVVCHPLQFNHSMMPSAEDYQKLFLPQSSLFLFSFDGPTAFLSGLRESESRQFQTFGDQDCHFLGNSTQGRVHCMGQEIKPEGMAVVATIDPPRMDLANSTPTPYSPSPISLSEADQALAMVPLVILSVLVLSGMLFTIGLFCVQKHRQIYYNSI